MKKAIALKINEPQLKEGDRAYLLIENLKIRKPSKKLNYKKVGLFLINKVYLTNDGLSLVNYKLQLPPDAKIHSVFYISLLKPADPSTPL